jgi:hypothetical protein
MFTWLFLDLLEIQIPFIVAMIAGQINKKLFRLLQFDTPYLTPHTYHSCVRLHLLL